VPHVATSPALHPMPRRPVRSDVVHRLTASMFEFSARGLYTGDAPLNTARDAWDTVWKK
jgi:hypothetical protein